MQAENVLQANSFGKALAPSTAAGKVRIASNRIAKIRTRPIGLGKELRHLAT
jgi:hypothetical protein